jgi:dihydropteroate synthase
MSSAPHALAPRTAFDWHLRTRTLALGPRTCIMAILNVTPDSFSDGGNFLSPEKAVSHAITLLDQGADILDIGGESTRPNATPVTPDEEQTRVLPVIEAILKARPQALLSIDTFHAATARAAIQAGAEIVNDVSGHLWDLDMSSACAQLRCGIILMHTRGTPQNWHEVPPLHPLLVMPTILTGLRDSIYAARTAGTRSDHILLDPGFGFGKLGDDNYVVHALFRQLHQFGLPILSGTSRKGFLRQTLRQLPQQLGASGLASETSVSDSPQALLHATTASNTAAILSGAHILRVHEVPPAIAAAAVADAILHATAQLTQ